MIALNNQKRNLIISPVGDNSCHRGWIKSGHKEFDVMLIYFGDKKKKYHKDADYYLEIKGLFKLENISMAIKQYYSTITKYDAVCLPDDDITMDAAMLNHIFRIFHKYNLDMAQPTIAAGVRSHAFTRQKPEYILRFVNWVEMMCPIFKKSTLLEILPTFMLNRSGYGIDVLWGKVFEGKRIAAIDRCGIYHKVQYKGADQHDREYNKTLANKGIDYRKEENESVCRYGASAHDQIEYGKIKGPYVRFVFLWTRAKRMQFICLLREKGLIKALLFIAKRIQKVIKNLVLCAQ